MLEATKALGLGFRAHVKTHKVKLHVLIGTIQRTNDRARLPNSPSTKWVTSQKISG